MFFSFIIYIITTLSMPATDGWWMTEPVSLIQTNLRETDSDLDPIKLVKEVKDFPANTILFSVGGITAHYPTNVEFHYRSDYLPEGKDLVGDVINEAHKNNIRIIGRFDFSRTRKSVYETHPEWFFKKKDGNPVFDDNDLYSICINGDYYNEKAIEILTEALEQYEVDGLFFNWFGNISSDYHGRSIGLCHCDVCEMKFRTKYGRSIPNEPDKDYRSFIHQSALDVAKKFSTLIHEIRPRALFMTYIEEHTDGIVSEADFYKWRPLPQWIYSSSQHVNRALNTKQDKMAFNLVMPYQEMRYRFGSTAGTGLRSLLYQNMAHGAFPAFVVLGTLDQPDKTAQIAVKPVFSFYKEHQDMYVGQKNAARVILYARQGPNWSSHNKNYRGFFRLLSELHIPFKVTNQINNINPNDIDLIVVPSGPTPEELRPYISKGGAVLIAGTTHPGLNFEKIIKHWEDAKSTYMRIEDHTLFPSLKDTWVLFWEGDYLELSPSPTPITLIPPAQFGPPDKVSTLEEVTTKPGLIVKEIGKGKIVYIPWNIGELYYEYSNDKHHMFISDLVDHLVPERQLITDTHPAVEITVMKQPKTGQTLLHLINLSGHSGTAFFEAVEMHDISIRLLGNYSRASEIGDQKNIPLSKSGGYTQFSLSKLEEYAVICLEK